MIKYVNAIALTQYKTKIKSCKMKPQVCKFSQYASMINFCMKINLFFNRHSPRSTMQNGARSRTRNAWWVMNILDVWMKDSFSYLHAWLRNPWMYIDNLRMDILCVCEMPEWREKTFFYSNFRTKIKKIRLNKHEKVIFNIRPMIS